MSTGRQLRKFIPQFYISISVFHVPGGRAAQRRLRSPSTSRFLLYHTIPGGLDYRIVDKMVFSSLPELESGRFAVLVSRGTTIPHPKLWKELKRDIVKDFSTSLKVTPIRLRMHLSDEHNPTNFSLPIGIGSCRSRDINSSSKLKEWMRGKFNGRLELRRRSFLRAQIIILGAKIRDMIPPATLHKLSSGSGCVLS